VGKYDPLNARLEAAGRQQVALTFAEIEGLIGVELPKGARLKRGWWADSDEGHASAWTAAGYTVEEVDLKGERVTYQRVKATKGGNGAGGHAAANDDGAAGRLGQAGEQIQALVETGLEQAGELLREAGPALRRYGPYLLLGVAAAAVAGFFVLRAQDEG